MSSSGGDLLTRSIRDVIRPFRFHRREGVLTARMNDDETNGKTRGSR